MGRVAGMSAGERTEFGRRGREVIVHRHTVEVALTLWFDLIDGFLAGAPVRTRRRAAPWTDCSPS